MTNITGDTNLLSSFRHWLDRPREPQRGAIPLLRYLLRLFYIIMQQFLQNTLSLRASALTYAVLLSMVPMLAMSTAVIKGLGGGNQLRDAAYSYLATLERADQLSTPEKQQENTTQETDSSELETPPTLVDHLRSGVDQLFDYVDRTNFATLGTLGVIGVLLSVILVFGNVESAMNCIWKVDSGRPILRKIADYLTLLVLLPLSINLAFAATAFIKNPKLSLTIDFYIPLDWIQTLLLQALPFFFITLSFYVMYIFFTNTKVKTIPGIIGASVAACCWLIIQSVYINMQIGVAKYNAIYGSFATFPLFLVWIHLSWLFILSGSQIAYAIQNEKKFHIVPLHPSPATRLSAAFDVMKQVYEGFAKGEKLERNKLICRLSQYHPEILFSTLKTLQKHELLGKTPEGYYLPLSAIEQYDTSHVVEAIFGTKAPDTSGGRQSLLAIEAARNSVSAGAQKDE